MMIARTMDDIEDARDIWGVLIEAQQGSVGVGRANVPGVLIEVAIYDRFIRAGDDASAFKLGTARLPEGVAIDFANLIVYLTREADADWPNPHEVNLAAGAAVFGADTWGMSIIRDGVHVRADRVEADEMFIDVAIFGKRSEAEARLDENGAFALAQGIRLQVELARRFPGGE